MQVEITVKRITEYNTIIEMDKETYERLSGELQDSRTRDQAEEEIDEMINPVGDWVDDELYDLTRFEAQPEQEPEEQDY